MARLACPNCGLSYAAETLPQHLSFSTGASCPRCATPMTGPVERARRVSPQERHRAAVERTVSWAEQEAANGDFAAALSWLAAIEAIDGELPEEIAAKRRAWEAGVQEQTVGR